MSEKLRVWDCLEVPSQVKTLERLKSFLIELILYLFYFTHHMRYNILKNAV